MRPEGLCQWKIPVTPSGIEPTTLRLIVQCPRYKGDGYVKWVHMAQQGPCNICEQDLTKWGISWLADELSASKEWPCSIHLLEWLGESLTGYVIRDKGKVTIFCEEKVSFNNAVWHREVVLRLWRTLWYSTHERPHYNVNQPRVSRATLFIPCPNWNVRCMATVLFLPRIPSRKQDLTTAKGSVRLTNE